MNPILFEIEKYLLDKNEIPIRHDTCFTVPIPPILVEKSIMLDPNIACNIFSDVAMQWYEDLTKHLEIEPDEQKKQWYKEVFLDKKPRIIQRYSLQVIEHLQWENSTYQLENGLTSGFSISRNSGGSLYFNRTETYDYPMFVKFTPEKLNIYSIPNRPKGCVYKYQSHNIDYFPGALFLRNWALEYINTALRNINQM